MSQNNLAGLISHTNGVFFRFVLVPGVGTKPPTDWRDEDGQFWLSNIPSNMAVYAFAHNLTPQRFTWSQLFQQGERFLKLLIGELGLESAKCASEANGLPIVVIAHSVGGFIVEEVEALENSPIFTTEELTARAGCTFGVQA